MINQLQLQTSPGFVTVGMLNEKLKKVQFNQKNKIQYIKNENDTGNNNMPYNTGLYYFSFGKEGFLPDVFVDDAKRCHLYKKEVK